MRVLYVDQSSALGGAQIALYHTVTNLNDVEVRVALFEDGPLASRLRAVGVDVCAGSAASSISSPFVTLGPRGVISYFRQNIVGLFGQVRAIREQIRIFRPDIVHASSMKATVVVGIASFSTFRRPKLVFHQRERLSKEYMRPAARSIARSAFALFPDLIISNSQSTASTLPPRVRPQDRVVLPSPIEVPSIKRTKQLFASETLNILSLSRLAAWKGQVPFVKSLPDIVSTGTPLRVRVAGAPQFGEDEYRAELHRTVANLGLQGTVELIGHVNDIWPELAWADVLVHTSILPEPLGQVVLQGMAAGCIVLAANAGGPAEIIRDGETGLLYQMGNFSDLREKIAEITSDPARASRIAKRGQEAAKGYRVEMINAHLIGHYESLLRGA